MVNGNVSHLVATLKGELSPGACVRAHGFTSCWKGDIVQIGSASSATAQETFDTQKMSLHFAIDNQSRSSYMPTCLHTRLTR
ncbi:hypothetical protein FPOAC2_04481 [Fusarium poae]|uniref:hypothetical protein n=1 Tax=Fusarium poae TaxID=36050 RepID=UPI001CEB1C43|nr:hypothetical protein FPOAC1_004396 [Fusarium poae]KAG8671157.1 hypothetical protein FPOAC1_004396 [Fusarium poae]